jgi:hypothetical protein
VTRFEGMQPWSPGDEIIEIHEEHERVDLHNDCILSMVKIHAEGLLPTLSLNFRHESGEQYRLAFAPIMDLVLVQELEDWHTYLAEKQDEDSLRECANFFGFDFWEGPGDISRFAVKSMLGHLHFKSPLVRWSKMT